MDYRNRDNFRELIGRFLGLEEATKAAEDIERGDRLLELYPAPQPAPRLLSDIKERVRNRLGRRHHVLRQAYRLIGPFGRQPTRPSEISYASLIPTAIWESRDISADDAELAYFSAEIDQLEAQMRALQAGDDEFADADALDEVEVELMRIDTEFWRE